MKAITAFLLVAAAFGGASAQDPPRPDLFQAGIYGDGDPST